MADIISSLNVGEEMRSRLIVKVTLARSFKLRMWLAVQMLRVVAYVCPLTVEIDDTGRGRSDL